MFWKKKPEMKSYQEDNFTYMNKIPFYIKPNENAIKIFTLNEGSK